MEIKYTGMELKLHRHGIRTALASVFGAMLIATPLVGDSALANGIVTGQVFWFHLSMALMAVGAETLSDGELLYRNVEEKEEAVRLHY